ncbi:unnamed protein product [Rhizoctonia solani]|uniref:Ethanolamine utilization protein EutQ n=1 Tax=Rhizoctonia solani TaxID=456999 RepID=A0A8H3C6E6_9AGAM|nr:unnamed protein product [Rhizoctonia solani]
MPIDINPGAQANFPLPSIGPGAALDDVFTSKDEEKPISGGLFTMVAADEPLVYTYGYHELKIILEGEIHLEDAAKPGEVIKAKAGDVLRIEKGTTVKFTSPTQGKAFYVGQRGYRAF